MRQRRNWIMHLSTRFESRHLLPLPLQETYNKPMFPRTHTHTHSHTAMLGTSVCACNLHTSPANLHKCLGICIYFRLYKEGLLCWRVLLGLTIFTIAAFRYLNNPSNGKFISIQISCRVTGEITCSQHPHQTRV